jgi:hypothetical protein
MSATGGARGERRYSFRFRGDRIEALTFGLPERGIEAVGAADLRALR